MCNPSVDCPYCNEIETCSKVRAAFPTLAELALEKNGRRPGSARRNAQGKKYCAKHDCMLLRWKQGRYCLEHQREKDRNASIRRKALR